jgi:hypothetical protein
MQEERKVTMMVARGNIYWGGMGVAYSNVELWISLREGKTIDLGGMR